MNTPDGYVISYYPHLGVFTFSKELVSWETATGVDRISAGMEKYNAPEGSRLALTTWQNALLLRDSPQTLWAWSGVCPTSGWCPLLALHLFVSVPRMYDVQMP